MPYTTVQRWLVFGAIFLYALSVSAQDGKVRIQVEPKQAYIFVDGTPFGDGARAIKIASGHHTVAAYNYGFAPQTREVTVEPGNVTQLEFKLDPVAGDVTGPWGRIQLNLRPALQYS